MTPETEGRALRRALAWPLAYLALLLVVLATYAGTLRQGFVADDFCHLRFLRDAGAPLLRLLDPTFAPSDPVTGARYLPLKIVILLSFERTFGLDAAPYHAASILVHALNALLVGHLGLTVFRDRTVGALAAVLFATSRLAAQNVCWMVCLPNLFGTTLLFASVAIYLRLDRGIARAAVGSLLLFASFLCRSDAAASVVFFLPLWVKDALIDKRRPQAWFAGLSSAWAAVFVALTAVSLRHFPEPAMQLGLSPRRIHAFLVDLFVPFEVPVAGKTVAVVAVCAAALWLRDRRLHLPLFGIGVGAIAWAAVVYLALTPRYLYAYTALAALVLAVLVQRGCARAFGRRGPVVAIAAVVLAGGLSARTIARTDVVWFDYLSIPGRKLLALKERQRAAGAREPLRVSMTPSPLLIDADAAFFEPELRVVRDGTQTVTVDTERERFVRYYGRDFGGTFWYLPWFER